ncbi:hypothetical protein U8335_01865 [Roseiconus lacunae]|uniref:hypothetical protein n=1 Tax=Roseiconus lacunae TaxID=2605694 RepID=UPI00308A0259|nr:hypothetical protein U8335_01865 [Stieleria sp. HD01]
MYASRHQFATYLTAIALLLSNLASVAHVGCVDSSACCTVSVHEQDASAPTQIDDEDVQVAGESCECALHRRRASLASQSASINSASTQRSRLASSAADDCDRSCCDDQRCGDQPCSGTPANEHDSNHCSLCQHFYTARLATIAPATLPVAPTPEVTGRVTALPSLHRTLSTSDDISARGPPQV